MSNDKTKRPYTIKLIGHAFATREEIENATAYDLFYLMAGDDFDQSDVDHEIQEWVLPFDFSDDGPKSDMNELNRQHPKTAKNDGGDQ